MNKISKKVMKAVAALGKHAAFKAAGEASAAHCHQPKEPAALKNMKK